MSGATAMQGQINGGDLLILLIINLYNDSLHAIVKVADPLDLNIFIPA